MQQWFDDWIGRLITGAVSILTLLAGRSGYRWVVQRKRDNAETEHITATSHLSTLQMSDQLLREWMRSANDAATALLSAQRKLIDSEICIRECIRLMKEAGMDVTAVEAKMNAIHGQLNK